MFAGLANEPVDVARFQPIPPGFRSFGLRPSENLREGSQILIGVEQIHDMHSIGEMGLGNRVVMWL